MPISEVLNIDCKEGMMKYPDKHFDLAIVDPPYFSGPELRGFYGRKVSSHGVKRVEYPIVGKWSIPNQNYFDELYRVSKHQIIWGCNYFQTIYPGTGRIIWDKVNDGSTFSNCEIAYCSLHNSVKIFRYMWRGMMQGKSLKEPNVMQGDKSLNEKKIHPTQKPAIIYKLLLQTYAQQGFKILDTHLGSGSLRIAAYELGFDFTAFEIEKIHFDNQEERFNNYKSQLKLFV